MDFICSFTTKLLRMKKYVVLVAGGSGSRMKSVIPKQFLMLNDKPVLMHTIQKFHDFDATIHFIVVLPDAEILTWKAMCERYSFNISHQVVAGGLTRFHSVQRGLSLVIDDGLVAIHDGVRPLVSMDTLARVYKCAEEKGNAIPCIAVTDSIRKLHANGSAAVARNEFRLIQTPQCFNAASIKAAYGQTYDESFTDCASVLEAFGVEVNLVEGNVENIKLTTPSDLVVATALLTNASNSETGKH